MKDSTFTLIFIVWQSILVALALFLMIFVAVPAAFAQGPTLIQPTPTELRASQSCAEVRGTGAQTATLTPPAGQFVYINSIEAAAFAQAGSAGIATAASLTTTNLPGSLTLGLFGATANLANTGGTLYQNFIYTYSGNGMKSNNAGTAVTVVAPSVTNMGWHLAVCGYFAP